jgi:hypothetical protein
MRAARIGGSLLAAALVVLGGAGCRDDSASAPGGATTELGGIESTLNGIESDMNGDGGP